ncbi:MAG: hypothetical protein WA364_27340 [Candidatus Nitrosopolaris sp.]
MDSYDPLIELEKFKPDFYNLIILDIKMPELDGNHEPRISTLIGPEVDISILS